MAVPPAQCGAHQCLGGMRKAVQPVGHEGQEVEQQRVGSQHHVALLGARVGKPAEGAQQAQRAQKNVGVQTHQPAPGVAREQFSARERGQTQRPLQPQQQHAQRKPGDVRQRCRRADATDTHARPQHQAQHRRHVDRVDEHLQQQRAPHLLAPEQGTEHHIVGQRKRR